MKRFKLLRTHDVSGVSGTGPVAEGIVFTDGTAVMKWYGERSSINIYQNVDDLLSIHDHTGTEHEGHNRIIWMDKD